MLKTAIHGQFQSPCAHRLPLPPQRPYFSANITVFDAPSVMAFSRRLPFQLTPGSAKTAWLPAKLDTVQSPVPMPFGAETSPGDRNDLMTALRTWAMLCGDGSVRPIL